MAVVQIYQYFSIDADTHSVQGGSLSEARSITLGDGEVIDRTFKIGTETAVKVFDASEDVLQSHELQNVDGLASDRASSWSGSDFFQRDGQTC